MKDNQNTIFTASQEVDKEDPFEDLIQDMDDGPNSPNLTMAGSPRGKIM